MAREPLNQFAQRIIRNGEVEEFILALMEHGMCHSQIRDAAAAAEEKRRVAYDAEQQRRTYGDGWWKPGKFVRTTS